MKVAFLGLGIMGGPMAANLAKAGHEVTVWNRTPGKIIEGARIAATPAEAAKGAEVVWICVSDTNAVEQVLFGPHGVASILEPGMIVADSSTILPTASRGFAERIREKGVEFVDAPVTGSKVGAEAGKLVFMVGGATKAVESLQPLFRVMGKQVIHVGEVGMGESLKICVNLISAMIFEGVAESFALMRKLGVPVEKMLELLQASAVRSVLIDNKTPQIVKRDFTPNFPLRLMHKDIQLMLEAAAENGAKLPALEKVQEVYQMAMRDNLGDLDYAATVAVLEKMAGLDLGVMEAKSRG